MIWIAELAMAASLMQQGLTGETAPDFSLQDLNDRQVSLKALRGRVVVLHFWATYWPECYADMTELERLSRELKGRGVAVLGINVGQLPRLVREFVRKKALTYPQLVNARGELVLAYQATDAPTLVVVGKDGKVVEYLHEAQGEERLKAALAKALE